MGERGIFFSCLGSKCCALHDLQIPSLQSSIVRTLLVHRVSLSLCHCIAPSLRHCVAISLCHCVCCVPATYRPSSEHPLPTQCLCPSPAASRTQPHLWDLQAGEGRGPRTAEPLRRTLPGRTSRGSRSSTSNFPCNSVTKWSDSNFIISIVGIRTPASLAPGHVRCAAGIRLSQTGCLPQEGPTITSPWRTGGVPLPLPGLQPRLEPGAPPTPKAPHRRNESRRGTDCCRYTRGCSPLRRTHPQACESLCFGP